MPQAYEPVYHLGWELPPENAGRLIADVRAEWLTRGELTELEFYEGGGRQFTVVEPDGYNATFSVTPPDGEDDRATTLASISAAGPCAAQPEDERFPPGVDSSRFYTPPPTTPSGPEPTPAP